MEKLYRIIGKEEIVEIQSDSNTTLSPRKQRVIDLLPQIFDVCSLAAKCNIKIASALRIATQYGWVKNQIQEYLDNHKENIPLDLFLIFDENRTEIPLSYLIEFIISYNQKYEQYGTFLDEDAGDGQYLWEGIWELVRQKQYPNLPSRLYSAFFFSDIRLALDFQQQYAQINTILVTSEIASCKIEQFDMEWITKVPINSTMETALEYADCYWAQKKTSNPVIETLLNGFYILKEIRN